jgi:hypothetical protein
MGKHEGARVHPLGLKAHIGQEEDHRGPTHGILSAEGLSGQRAGGQKQSQDPLTQRQAVALSSLPQDRRGDERDGFLPTAYANCILQWRL